MSIAPIVVGVDVGGRRKGFHAVALCGLEFRGQLWSLDASEIVDWCGGVGAVFVGIDAPCSWSRDGQPRSAELLLQRKRIGCFWSPTRERAVIHPKDNYGWMLNGETLFEAFAVSYTLFKKNTPLPDKPICFETFPQAVACALAGKIVSAKAKGVVRRDLLRRAGINIDALTNIDKVDAALCALTALHLAIDDYETYGDDDTGHIVVPRAPLAASVLALS